ncbi:unnamed protein product, partial [Allacma fusca]
NNNSCIETNDSTALPTVTNKEVKMISYHQTNKRRYREVSSGKWLYDDRFSFEKEGAIFRCGSCQDAVFQDLRSIANHVRKYHYLRPSTKPINRFREIEPNKFL